ncbi:helix-turn-helix transcriptional regulator [Streptomyces sp. NPDC058653]|uniref:helix-turn-helix transcriptional regulator n=1 Tax=Streptomyces sp. NPDC058653 TaxID=3346576 RepID=UPI003654A460
MRKQGELGDFLRSRRARIQPEDVGYASGSGQRRVPGLRREELAHLAGVSVDYYVRLEQGRNQGVSDAVLGAVADALRLDRDEREHLFRLARPQKPGAGGTVTVPAASGATVRPEVQRLLDWITAPALAMGRRLDVLAWNRPACGLITDFGALPPRERNMCRLHLLDEEIGSRYPDRDMVAREAVGSLRIAAGIHPDDGELRELVDELKEHSAEFRHYWAQHTVRTKSHGIKLIDHPHLGFLKLTYEITHFPQDQELSLLVYTAGPGTPEEKALRELADI